MFFISFFGRSVLFRFFDKKFRRSGVIRKRSEYSKHFRICFKFWKHRFSFHFGWGASPPPKPQHTKHQSKHLPKINQNPSKIKVEIPSRCFWARLECVLWAIEAVLEAARVVWGAFWGRLGSILSHLGACCERLARGFCGLHLLDRF